MTLVFDFLKERMRRRVLSASTKTKPMVNPLTLGTSPYAYRRLTIVQSVRLLFLVLYPLVGLPHGVCEIRPLLFPRPPPWG